MIELLWIAVLSLVVGGAATAFMIVSIRQENAISSRTIAARQGETGLEQLIRDLRQAMGSPQTLTISTNNSTDTTSINFSIPTPGSDTTPESVVWSCPSTASSATNAGTCTRTVGTGSPQTVISGVQSISLTDASGNTLSTATNPDYLNVTLKIQVVSQLDETQPATHIVQGAGSGPNVPSTNPVVVQAGVDLRNFS